MFIAQMDENRQIGDDALFHDLNNKKNLIIPDIPEIRLIGLGLSLDKKIRVGRTNFHLRFIIRIRGLIRKFLEHDYLIYRVRT